MSSTDRQRARADRKEGPHVYGRENTCTAKALQDPPEDTETTGQYGEFAASAYAFADAMLAERDTQATVR
ncbi:hypothetical protein C1141_21060 [Vibrio agarivorans]|nr:hypothetical protein C1141_21060 [Vibrio agarivorans]